MVLEWPQMLIRANVRFEVIRVDLGMSAARPVSG
jgi:hypothetical protein